MYYILHLAFLFFTSWLNADISPYRVSYHLLLYTRYRQMRSKTIFAVAPSCSYSRP